MQMLLYSQRSVDIFVVLKESLYRLLGRTAGVFFNILNLLMAGNLPPFGSVYVVVEEQGRYLALEQTNGKIALPGGFMRWREDSRATGKRECEEETGLQVRVLEMLTCFSSPATSYFQMSTLVLIYRAEITGGSLRRSIEGQPRWISEAEARQWLEPRYQPFIENYIRASHGQSGPRQESEPEHQASS